MEPLRFNEADDDVTEQLLLGAKKFLATLLEAQVHHAILMDGSPSCGSNVLLREESWPRGGFKRGVGVASALLRINGLNVLSSFDERSICGFLKSIDSKFALGDSHIDLREMPKFKSLFER